MRGVRRLQVPLAFALVLAATAVGDPARGAAGSCGTGVPPDVAAAGDDWPMANHDLRGTRAQLATRIGTTTVDELELVWSYDVPGDGLFGNLTTTPLVLGDTVYVGALDGSVHAVDLHDGTPRWAVPRAVTVFGPAGVAVGHDKVFGISEPDVVAAHDASDGSVLWTADVGPANGNQVDVQPIVYGGCLLVATQGLAPGSRGTLFALDEATGDEVWRFETVPDDFWGDPTRNHGGGAWYPPAIDEARARVYWGTSNPWPAPGAPGFPAGASRPGPNLHTNSALALDLAGGGLEWSHQVFPHDIWDRDMVLTQLVDLPGGGEVVVHTGKGGRVLGYDPDTGAVRWDVPVGTHMNDHLTEFDGPMTVMPGVLGGVETPPAAADGVVYLSVMNAPTTYTGPEQRFNLSVALGQNPSDLIALDARDGSIVWSTKLPGDGLGGATVAGDLVFTSTFQGLLLAYDRATGTEVWRHQADGFVNGWPAVVDDTIVFPVSGTEPSRLLAFRLPPAPPLPPTSTTTTPPSAAPASTSSTVAAAPATDGPPTTADPGTGAPGSGHGPDAPLPSAAPAVAVVTTGRYTG